MFTWSFKRFFFKIHSPTLFSELYSFDYVGIGSKEAEQQRNLKMLQKDIWFSPSCCLLYQTRGRKWHSTGRKHINSEKEQAVYRSFFYAGLHQLGKEACGPLELQTYWCNCKFSSNKQISTDRTQWNESGPHITDQLRMKSKGVTLIGLPSGVRTSSESSIIFSAIRAMALAWLRLFLWSPAATQYASPIVSTCSNQTNRVSQHGNERGTLPLGLQSNSIA